MTDTSVHREALCDDCKARVSSQNLITFHRALAYWTDQEDEACNQGDDYPAVVGRDSRGLDKNILEQV
eukprot:763323-Hanusia_phi.AAC.1